MAAVRENLSVYYSQIKSLDEYISFVFVTGVTKFFEQDSTAAFNSFADISVNPKYGTLTGFTHEEVKSYYKWRIQEVAERQKMNVDNLLAKMKDYYYGFCFDSERYVYNPFTILQFFDVKEFDNFWFDSGPSDQIVNCFRNNRLTVEDFRGISVHHDDVDNPLNDEIPDPRIFLYQFGYLSLRPSEKPREFKLDYPNVEVLGSISRRVLESLFNSAPKAEIVCDNLRKAAENRDPSALVAALNALLSILPYDDLKDYSFGDSFFRGQILTLFYAAGLATRHELHGNPERSDFTFNYSGQSWVLNLKLNIDAKKSDGGLAKESLKQILDENYGGAFVNPNSCKRSRKL
jgi:hypothetical protein